MTDLIVNSLSVDDGDVTLSKAGANIVLTATGNLVKGGNTVTIPAGTDTILTETSTATLTNKTISGASNTLSNIAQSSVTNLTTDLGNKQPLDTQLTDLAALAYASNSLKVVRVNAGETAFELATPTTPTTIKFGGIRWRSSTATASIVGSGSSRVMGTPVLIPTSSGETSTMSGTASGFTIGTTTASLSYNATGFVHVVGTTSTRAPSAAGGVGWLILRINGVEVARSEDLQYASTGQFRAVNYTGSYTSGHSIDLAFTYDGGTKTYNFDDGQITCIFISDNT